MHYNEYYAVKMARQLMQVQTGSKWGGGGGTSWRFIRIPMEDQVIGVVYG